MFPAFKAKTSAVFIDDDNDFLNDLFDYLPKTHNFIKFTDPRMGLDKINSHHDQYKRISLTSLKCIWSNFKKIPFEEIISVTIIDHQMAPIDGIKLCRSIKTPYVKKIMLTSYASEQLAIEALNNRWIDTFLKKTERNLTEKITEILNRATNQFFCELSGKIEGYQNEHNQLLNTKCSEYLYKYFRKNSIQQFTCIHDFNTIWMKDKNGIEQFLTIYSDETIDELLSTNQSNSAPKEILDQVMNKKAAPCFTNINSPLTPDGTRWTSFMRRLIPIENNLYVTSF